MPECFTNNSGSFSNVREKEEGERCWIGHFVLADGSINMYNLPPLSSSLTVFIKCCGDVNAFDTVITLLGAWPKEIIRNGQNIIITSGT